MEHSHKNLPLADFTPPIPSKCPHQAAVVSSSAAPLQNQQQKKKEKGTKAVDSQQPVQKGVSKIVQPVNSGRDSESSHRLSFLLQAAHLTRGMSSSLSR
jgi:hypothetical protein